jgi:hypothetical protein
LPFADAIGPGNHLGDAHRALRSDERSLLGSEMSKKPTKILPSIHHDEHEAQFLTGVAAPSGDGPQKPETVCAVCGRPRSDLPPIADADYFNVIMRVGRPLRNSARSRHELAIGPYCCSRAPVHGRQR